MTASWPPTIPQLPDREGWRETFPKNVIRSQNDQGVAKQRRRGTGGVRPYQVNMTMSGQEVIDFDTFWTTDLGEGALPFTHLNARTGLTHTYQFHGDTPPTVVNIGGDTYRVGFLLEQLP